MKFFTALTLAVLTWLASPAYALAHGGEEGVPASPGTFAPEVSPEPVSSGMPPVVLYGSIGAALVALAAFAVAGFLFFKDKGK